MKKASAILASAIVATALLSAGAANATVSQSEVLDMNSFTMPTLSPVHQGDVVNLTISNLGTGNGVYVNLCEAATANTAPYADDSAYATHCDQVAADEWLVNESTPGGTLASVGANIKMNANFGSTHCMTTDCVIYVTGDHNHMHTGALIRIIPITFARATATIATTWPAASKFKVGKTFAVAKSSFISNVGETVHLASKSPKYCTVASTSTGWKIKSIKTGSCQLKVVTLADANGAYGSKTISKNFAIKK